MPATAPLARLDAWPAPAVTTAEVAVDAAVDVMLRIPVTTVEVEFNMVEVTAT